MTPARLAAPFIILLNAGTSCQVIALRGGQLSRRDHAMPLLRMCFAMCVLAVCSGEALAIDSRVRSACERDYMIYCSRHDPDGPGVRRCMRTAGERLSTACLNALVAAGEVSKREIAKRSK